jgi:hypothetical protein
LIIKAYAMVDSKLNLNEIGSIHLSHNQGYADTHDLIPANAWFNEFITDWSDHYLVTYESLPIAFSGYQRLDKIRQDQSSISKPGT